MFHVLSSHVSRTKLSYQQVEQAFRKQKENKRLSCQRRVSRGIGQSLTIVIWRAGGTPKTHNVPLFCDMGKLAVVTNHFLSAALTFLIQERQVTSFCGVSPILHRIKKCSYGAYGAKDKPGDIPLPRSLTRCARSFGCGERRE